MLIKKLNSQHSLNYFYLSSGESFEFWHTGATDLKESGRQV